MATVAATAVLHFFKVPVDIACSSSPTARSIPEWSESRDADRCFCVSVHIAKGGAVYQQMCAQMNHGFCIQWVSLYLRNGTLTLALQMNFENSVE